MLREPQLLVVKFEKPLLTVLNTALGKGAAGKLTEEKKEESVNYITDQKQDPLVLFHPGHVNGLVLPAAKQCGQHSAVR